MLHPDQQALKATQSYVHGSVPQASLKQLQQGKLLRYKHFIAESQLGNILNDSKLELGADLLVM